MPTRSFAIAQHAQCAGQSRLVQRHGRRPKRRAVKFGSVDEQVVRHHDGHRPRFIGQRQLKRLAHRVGNVLDPGDGEDALGHLLQQADLREFVDLKMLVFVAACHIADDGDEGNAIEPGLADAGQGVGDARAWHDAQHAGPAGAARRHRPCTRPSIRA